MKCLIKEEHLLNSLVHHPTSKLNSKDTAHWPSIKERILEFFSMNSVEHVTVYMRHIILRSKGLSLALLSNTRGSNQGIFLFQCGRFYKYVSLFIGSHMCDTIGCIEEDHLLIETHAINQSRQRCHGVTLHIYRNKSGTGHILQLKPCSHGRKQQGSMDDQLNYSCRKIYAIISEDKAPYVL
jgi:hypothetical protein